MTTRRELSDWFDRGVREGATHMIVVVDEFDHEDFPVYVKPGEDPVARYHQEAEGHMQRVMEVYCLSLDRDAQLRETRAFHLDLPPQASRSD
ncbi:hypothetical protein [Micromonospora maritima]|uniref:hypothetical protein n=1 Tax=Micromonospora maritima TaxID=986711 RepID=UPI00157CA502|nr:hypothetical protein [Micromonospora maritima]